MQHRRFGALDWQVSVLGFGTGRLPKRPGNLPVLDQDRSLDMLCRALALGVNYIDLGYPYDGDESRQLCRIARQALQQGDDADVKLAVTLPAAAVSAEDDFERYLDRHLEWLHRDRVDFCLLGSLDRQTWARLQAFKVLRWLDKALADGRISHPGFSIHDHFMILKTIIGAYANWSVCQLRYSYMDVLHNPGTSGVHYAARQGLAVVATETLRSGRLVKHPPDDIAALWDGCSRPLSPAEWALRFAWNEPAVSVVVVDMESSEQVQQVAAFADRARPDSLSMEAEVVIGRVREAFGKRRVIACPACRPCLPCPVDIDIARIFEIYNEAVMFEDAQIGQAIYRREGHRADQCIQCGECMQRCTKRFPIVDLLSQAHQLLGGSV